MRGAANRERFLARRAFTDPAFVQAILLLVERQLSEARGSRGLWRLYDTVRRRAVGAGDEDVLAIPDHRFPERGRLDVAGVATIVPLRTLGERGRWLSGLLREMAAFYDRRAQPVEAQMFGALARKVEAL